MIIETSRLVLHPYVVEDYEAMKELLTNEEIKKTYMIPDFMTEEEIKKFFEKIKSVSYDPNRIDLGIYEKGKLIGFINDVCIENEMVELGYVIHPSKKGRGYATEVLSKMIQILWERGFHKIRTGAFEENLASRRVMEKCGMKMTSEHDTIEYKGVTHACVFYEIEK